MHSVSVVGGFARGLRRNAGYNPGAKQRTLLQYLPIKIYILLNGTPSDPLFDRPESGTMLLNLDLRSDQILNEV